ncbi:hypothetical protein S7335_414 [Synechococcus sp. PCC 7335]|uniref:WD40 repeat domain-containing protein n=1 Tax=Synechococcus sp. (strain ATCC 29403 / PCC 7335) TaxID=91464 RepID=UPI00017EC7F4|nr:hypothetical protein [Synechococcus sp. PCC 7335]EDX83235.1 hypothetical protein S7335_414 [Synechococcus sp. PCC 7335]
MEEAFDIDTFHNQLTKAQLMATNGSRNLQKSHGCLLRKHAARGLAILLICLPSAANATSAPFGFFLSRHTLIETPQTDQNEKPIKADEPTTERKEESDRESQLRNERTVLYNLDGSVASEFAGIFFEITPDGQRVITYSVSASQWYLYTLDGTEHAALKGHFQGFTPDQQSIITYSQGKSYLYNLDGVEQATFAGTIQWGTVDGDYLIAVSDDRPGFLLYSAEGSLQATFEGFFRGFVPSEQKLVVTDNDESRLYNFDGSLDATFEGVFQVFTPDSKGVVTVTYGLEQPASRSLLYDLDGTLRATFKGEFSTFSPDGTALVTDSRESSQSWLYGLDDQQQATLKGDFIAFSRDGQSLFTYSNAGTHRYALNGQQQGLFAGRLVGITSDAQRLVLESPTQQSWLYDIDGRQLSTLEGMFVGFISDERRIITLDMEIPGLNASAEGFYRLYNLEGSLQSSFQGQLLGLTATGNQGLVLYADDGKSHLYDSLDGTEQTAFEGRVLGLTIDEQGVFIGF